MENIEKQIKDVEAKLKELKEKKVERENQTNIGVISIADDKLKIELLLNADDFSEKHIEKLTKIANDLQNLLSDVYKEVK